MRYKLKVPKKIKKKTLKYIIRSNLNQKKKIII